MTQMLAAHTFAPFDPNKVYEISTKEIEADDNWNCRGFINPVSILELANSIKSDGLQSPVLVMPTPGQDKPFKLVAGYRRFKAHQINGADTIRAIVKLGLDETEARILNLTENLQREDLNIKQEANAIRLLRLMGRTEVAQRLKKPLGWVEVRFALLNLPEDIQDEAVAGRLTNSEIMKCARLDTVDEQYDYVRRVKDQKLAGKKREVKAESKKTAASETRLRTEVEIEEMQATIRRIFGHGLATKALAWAGGFISPYEMHDFIRKEAFRIDKHYEIPEDIEP